MALTIYKQNANPAQPVVKPISTGGVDAPAIAQSTLNDFTKNKWNPGMSETALDTDSAKLFIYSPTTIPDQVLRPYVYSFTSDFIDTVSSNTMTLEQMTGKMGGRSVPGLNSVILPDADGRVTNTSSFCQLWTFTLIIDYHQTQVGSSGVPHLKLIASGYFSEEPGTRGYAGEFKLNPNAVMMFTHTTTVTMRQAVYASQAASDGLVVVPSSKDYAGESVPIFYNESMYLGTPSELLKSALASPVTGCIDYNDMDLSQTKEGQGMKSIDTDLKSPKAQLSDIMKGLDAGIDHVDVNGPVFDSMMTHDDYIDPVQRSISYAVNALPSSKSINFNRGLDTSRSITLSELTFKFPNIEVYPSIIRGNGISGWDVASQVATNQLGQVAPILSNRQIFSALTSMTVQSICATLGIATIAFSYRWLDGDGISAFKNEAFQIVNFGFIVNRSQAVTQQTLNRFKDYLDNQLFEVIHDNCGEFEVNVLCDAAGTVLVDLHLYNYPTPQDGSYYQTDSKLGGILNPMVNNLVGINHNVNQIYNAALSISGKHFSDQTFRAQPFTEQELGQVFN